MANKKYRAGERVEFTVSFPLGARPLLPYVASHLGVCARRAERLFTLGAVRLDGRTLAADSAAALPRGARFEIVIPENWVPQLAAREMPLDILYEDEHLLAVNKPAGIVVHPARGHLDGNTVQNGVLFRYRDDPNPDKTIAPPHRLDKDTSGVLLFSRTGESYRALCAMMKNYAAEKTYLAITDGDPRWETLTVDLPLGDHPTIYGIGAVVDLRDGGKPARTDFRVLRRGTWRGNPWALVEARPHTGRAHQIRLHLQARGLPLAGDGDYNLCPRIRFPRQALHASALAFAHPFTGAPLNLTAPLPADMEKFINAGNS